MSLTSIIALLIWLSFSSMAFANISLSVNPIDGSNSLRFEASTGMGKTQEIHVRVNASGGDRYQVFQRILEPVVNEKGDTLNLQAISAQTLSNSNASGALYLQNTSSLSMGDQLLYSSSQGGESDAFIIGYTLNQALVNSSGNFRGRLVFTVRGLGNNFSDQVTIDVILNAQSNFKMSVKGNRNPTRIQIQGSDRSEETADFLNVSFSGNAGTEIRIYQEVDSMPQNKSDEEIGNNVLQIDPQGETDGLRLRGANPLGTGRALIYTSDKAQDDFLIYFLINPDEVQSQEAGIYNGKIRYVVETAQGRQEFPVNVQFTVPPIFTMNVVTPAGGVSFTHVLETSPPQEKEVVVAVESNLHVPYQVIEDLQSNMTNQQGKEFDNKYFNLQVVIPPGQKGQTDFKEYTPVQTGEYPVFSSDSVGSSATFTVLYRLQGYAQMSPGDFLAPIRFSLNQK